MKNKWMICLAFIMIMAFISMSTYFWYKYFWQLDNSKNINGDINEQLVLSNIIGKPIADNKIYEISDNIPKYKFQIANDYDRDINYILYIYDDFENQGFNNTLLLSHDQLNYELKLNGTIIAYGLLSDVENNIIDQRTLAKKMTNNYELKIWINNTDNSSIKQYSYKIMLFN